VTTEIEHSVDQLALRVSALGDALRGQRTESIAAEAAQLQRMLNAAVEPLRRGQLPPHVRQRLALAAGQVAAQRESLARASAALGRAIDVLLPAAAPQGAYSAAGLPQRPQGGGVLRA
jgi:hypothetical protein